MVCDKSLKIAIVLGGIFIFSWIIVFIFISLEMVGTIETFGFNGVLYRGKVIFLATFD